MLYLSAFTANASFSNLCFPLEAGLPFREETAEVSSFVGMESKVKLKLHVTSEVFFFEKYRVFIRSLDNLKNLLQRQLMRYLT